MEDTFSAEEKPLAMPLSPSKKVVKRIRGRRDIKKATMDTGDHVRRPFSPKSEKYIRKMDRLVKIYERVAEKNAKLRYHLLRVKKETEHLTQIKRNLCNRLSFFNDPYMDQNLEIPDNNFREVDVDKLIGDVITSTEPLVAPPNKKRRIDSKKCANKSKDDSKEHDSKKEVINRILSAASSVMKQEEQKVKKFENGKSECSSPSKRQSTSAYGNCTPSTSNSVFQSMGVPTLGSMNPTLTQNSSNVYFVTTSLPQVKDSVTSGNAPVKKALSPRIPTQVSHNIESSPLPGATDDQLKPAFTQSQTSTVASTSVKPVTTKTTTSFAVVTHHDLPRKNTSVPDPLNENKEIMSDSKSPVSKSQPSGRPPSPLHAQITTTPLPPKSKPDVPVDVTRPQQGSTRSFYTQPVNVYQDPTTINPQLLPHRQLNFRKVQEEQIKEEKSRQLQIQQGRINQNTTTMIIAPQQQMIVGPQGQMQQIVIPSSTFQQVPLIQSQPKLREALQNAGNEAKRQSTISQPIQLVQTVVPNQPRLVGPSGGQITSDGSNSQMVIDDNREIIYIDQSGITFGSRGEMKMIVPIAGSQTVRYLVPQTSIPPTIAISSQKPQTTVGDRLLRASSIDHLLPQNPDSSNLNDDNIDWSKYDEPKPKTKKNSTPKKRGANVKVDANSDAMARISPILAKFQQEMAQSTVAQEQQQQQQLAMAARNATKTTPVRARKRPTKTEKTSTSPEKLNTESLQPSTENVEEQPPSTAPTEVAEEPVSADPIPTSTPSNPPIQNSISPSKEPNPDIPTIIVTAATPEPGSKSPQKSQSDQKSETPQS